MANEPSPLVGVQEAAARPLEYERSDEASFRTGNRAIEISNRSMIVW